MTTLNTTQQANETHVAKKVALRMLACATMREFTQNDWAGFAGCESSNPMIGEIDGHTIVVDGNELLVVAHGDIGGGQQFTLNRNY